MVNPGETASEHSRILTGPLQVSFDITNKCNFRCLHCYNMSGENCILDEELSDPQVLDLMKDLSSMKLLNVCFCGGEPLLRKELIYQSAQILREGGTKHVSLVTNGYLLTLEIAKNLLASGIDRVQVSLDGADAEAHEKLRLMPGSYRKALEAMMIFSDAGFDDIDVAFCPTSFNVHQIEDVFDLCKQFGIKGLRVQPLMLLGRTNRNIDFILPTQLQYRQLVKTINSLKKTNTDMRLEWGDPVDHLIRFRTMCKHCVTFVSIKANGAIAISPYVPLVVGNVMRHRLGEYWEKGLGTVWEQDIVQGFVKKVSSIFDLNKTISGIPVVWEEKDIEFDIIDNMKGSDNNA